MKAEKTSKQTSTIPWSLVSKIVGIIGTLFCLIVFIREPSWPTPDKLLFLMTFIGMSLGQARQLLKRFVPFVGLLLVYESFRSIAHSLNNHVNFTWMPKADRFLFRVLPTEWLQHQWWHGHTQWYDFAFYIVYMMHFVLPLALAVVVWKLRDSYYWQYVTNYVILSFAGFLTYLLFPAAPPWMASNIGVIPHITRVSSSVWYSLGIHDFPSVYNKIAPNPVAAVPSLHAAYATMFVLIVHRLFGKKWAAVSLIYPFMIVLGTVYQGEHYAIDAILGILYAIVAFMLSDLAFKKLVPVLRKTTLYKKLHAVILKV